VVLRGHDWHAAVIACELRLERGAVLLLPRAHRQFLYRGCGGVELATAGASAGDGAVHVPAGQPVHLEVIVVGNRVTATVSVPGAARTPIELRIGVDERRGSLGLILRAGTAVTLGDLRLRVLD
jgi:hypothetical protein